MSILEQLKQALNEADENSFLSDQFQIDSDIKFNGKLNYTGDSKISLDLTFEIPTQTKSYISELDFDDVSEEQFSEASEKVQNALEKVAEEFKLSLRNKLASYGLQERE